MNDNRKYLSSSGFLLQKLKSGGAGGAGLVGSAPNSGPGLIQNQNQMPLMPTPPEHLMNLPIG
jgi:hypothetical protein